MNHEELDTHTVFGALTRPAMKGGVTLEYYSLNLILSVCAFIALSNVLYGLIFIPCHLFGWLVCRHDPRFFELVMTRFKLPSMPNQLFWRVRHYEPF